MVRGSGAARGTTGPLTVVLMGVSGVGKSSVMEVLAPRLGAAMAEGDIFHSAANVARMRAGIPLADDDRWPWLRSIADWIQDREREGRDAVVTCSALRRAYRDLLRDGAARVRFVHLVAPPATIEQRLAGRRGHYMPGSLLDSQLRILEPLEPDEPGFTIETDRHAAALADDIARRLAIELVTATREVPPAGASPESNSP